MKNLLLFAAAACSLTFVACGDDDDGAFADCTNDTGYTIGGTTTCATGSYDVNFGPSISLEGTDGSDILLIVDSIAGGTFTTSIGADGTVTGFAAIITNADDEDLVGISGTISLELADGLVGGTFEATALNEDDITAGAVQVSGAFSQLAAD